MNVAEYNSKLARAEELAALDPEPNSPEGLSLMKIVEELQEYEREHFPFQVTKEDIAMFRGGMPEKCDFCDTPTPHEQLEPEEAGDWVCWHCLLKWAEEDGRVNEAVFWKRKLKEVSCAH